MEVQTLQAIYKENKDRYLSEWKDFLRFQSISADPAYEKDCRACAEWLVKHLQGMGLKAELWETATKPVVYAEYAGQAGYPQLLYYGHYDVQPVDPLSLWTTPPFEPEIREGRLYARGAQDNKGQTFYVLKALETVLKAGEMRYPLKIFIEGEEETSSKGLTDALPGWKDKIKGDALLVCDTGAIGAGIPTITMGLRGLLFLSLKMTGPSYDLHSGSFGGIVKNPATEMARLLATFHDAEGRVAVEGFYEGADGVITDDDRRLANEAPVNYAEIEKQLGTPLSGGEKGWTPVERKGFRPTIEINGLHSGYGGPGNKTIIPSDAIAKVTARLVGKQDPEKTLQRIVKHLETHAPTGIRFEIENKGVGGSAILLGSKSPWIQKARTILQQTAGRKAVLSWEGGSIPVIALMAELSGAEPLLVGFGLEEDRIHAPNESFALAQFEQGFLYMASLLSGA